VSNLRILRTFAIDDPVIVDSLSRSLDHDVVWDHQQSDDLPDAGDSPIIIGKRPGDGGWIDHRFSANGKTNCLFSVSLDGRKVYSTARPWVSQSDINRLFDDVIMRTILTQMDLPSFHAAALEKDGGALLIMADKGCGKSTLSGALRQFGWTIMSDDLVRVVEKGGAWHALPGPSESKLNADSAIALGQDTLGKQWVDAVAATPNKHIYAAEALGERPSAPVAHIIFLDPRGNDTSARVFKVSNDGHHIMRLLQNATPDPTGAMRRPSQNLLETVAGLAKRASMSRISLPDDLALLLESAQFVDQALIALRRG
jgi:hypothetical protein